jgi:hypothetical protein
MKRKITKQKLLLVKFILLGFSLVSQSQVYNAGNIYVAPGASASFWGTFTNDATAQLDQRGTLYVNGDVTNAGAVNAATGSTTSFLGAGWTNTATATFTGTGSISFDGTTAQTIDGGYTTGAQPSFSGIIVNNSNGVSLVNTSAGVSNALTFSSGSITLDNYNLRLDASALISGAGAGKFTITNGTGYLVKEGVSDGNSFSFPVGRVANDYTPCTVANSSGSSRNYFVNVKDYAGSTPAEGNITSGIDRTWQIFGDAAGAATITLVHNAVTNTNGTGSNGTTFNNTAAYVTQQLAAGNWSTSTTTNNGGTPVNTLGSTAAAILPALVTDASGFFSKSSDIMSSFDQTIMAAPKALLQGAYSGSGLMTTTLRTAGLIPLKQPYNTMPSFGYLGLEEVKAIPAGVTDWVLVELRNAASPATAVATRAAFVKNDGTITDLDGVSPVRFKGMPAGNYLIAVRHRNHLGIRTDATRSFALETNTPYDFTTAQTAAYQNTGITANAAMKDMGSGVFAMWAGNVNANTNVRYSGLNNDLAALLAALGGNQSTLLTNVYSNADINMNGTVRYSGLNNDNTFLLSILGGNQAAIFSQH